MTRPPAAPATVGNYELLATLGEGGMGVVYEARHVSMGRRAAVKVLRSELAHNEDAVRRFFNEARAANGIHHPSIVQIYDCGMTAEGTPWLIMELLEGETLAARIARVGKLQVEAAVDICTQAASALGAAHAQGIVHRDLKPDNVYLVRDQGMALGERVKVLDFGIAKLGAASAGAARMTRTGTVMGTPMYMSPEQCRGTKEADARSDVYSLGLILYEALAGQPPFVSQGIGELFQMHMTVPPPRLEERAPSVELWLAGTVHKMIEKDPALRFQTMDELARALRAGESAPMVPAPASASVAPAPIVAALPDVPRTSPPESGVTQLLPEARAPGGAKGKTTLSASTAEMISRTRKGSAPRGAIFGALVATGAGAILLALMIGRSPGPEAPSSPPKLVAPAAATTAAEPAPVTPAPAPRPPAPPPPESEPGQAGPAASVVIDIATDPPGARVVDARDGSLIGVTPLRREIGKESGTLELRIDKRGFVPRTVTVPRDRGFEGMLHLSKVPPPEREKIIKL